MAFDFCVLKEQKAVWDIKVDVNENDIPDYEEFAKICKGLDENIQYGGDWVKKDRCHVQWKNGINIDQMVKEVEEKEEQENVEEKAEEKEKTKTTGGIIKWLKNSILRTGRES